MARIQLSTTLRDCVPGYNPVTGLLLELEEPASAGDIAQRIGLPLAEIKIIMLNGRHASLDTLVGNDDRLAYFPAVGGG